jgi:hypothetical protein
MSTNQGPSVLAPLGAISRAVNEAIGRAMLLDPALRDLLIGIGHALDDVIDTLDEGDHL